MEVNTKYLYCMEDFGKSKKKHDKLDLLLIALERGEPRGLKSIRLLEEKKIDVDALIVFDYNDDSEFVDKILSGISILKNAKISIMTCKKENYEKCFFEMKKKVPVLNNGSVVAIDISCIPIPHFFLILKYLHNFLNEINIYYTEPVRYIMNEGIFKSYFSTKGPIAVKEIIGYSGISAQTQSSERILICILGFDNDLLPTVIQESAPKGVVAVNGFPSFHPKFKDISMANNEKVLNGSSFAGKLERNDNLTNFIYAEANNPFEAYNTLLELTKKYEKYCIDIVPLGSKPMALGVCLYSIKHNDVRVVFPFPQEYANTISEESKTTWEYIIDWTIS